MRGLNWANVCCSLVNLPTSPCFCYENPLLRLCPGIATQHQHEVHQHQHDAMVINSKDMWFRFVRTQGTTNSIAQIYIYIYICLFISIFIYIYLCYLHISILCVYLIYIYFYVIYTCMVYIHIYRYIYIFTYLQKNIYI